MDASDCLVILALSTVAVVVLVFQCTKASQPKQRRRGRTGRFAMRKQQKRKQQQEEEEAAGEEDRKKGDHYAHTNTASATKPRRYNPDLSLRTTGGITTSFGKVA